MGIVIPTAKELYRRAKSIESPAAQTIVGEAVRKMNVAASLSQLECTVGHSNRNVADVVATELERLGYTTEVFSTTIKIVWSNPKEPEASDAFLV